MAALTIFLITYLGVAMGRIPALTLDRTGIALLGAIAMVVSGSVTLDQAVGSIDFPTILLLYGLMVVSAQLRLGGFYTWAALKIAGLIRYPRFLLFCTMLLSGLLSALLANDIICLAFTPVLAISLANAGLNPVPYLLGLATASNIGSAATIIGNPQNMLIGQLGNLHFGAFLLWSTPPAFLSLLGAFLFITFIYRGRLESFAEPKTPNSGSHWPDLNKWQSGKGLAATVLLVILFFTSFPREFAALAVAGLLLCSRRMKSRLILELIDWHLITLFCALFVVIAGIGLADIPAQVLHHLNMAGLNPGRPLFLLIITTILSNLVSNVPAVMLLTSFLDKSSPMPWYTLAAASTYAGNLIVIGSIANLIVIEQARKIGITISFREHFKTGLPVTLLSLTILAAWLFLTA